MSTFQTQPCQSGENLQRETLILKTIRRNIERFALLPENLQLYIVRNYVFYECPDFAKSNCSNDSHHHSPLIKIDSFVDSQIFIPIYVFVTARWEYCRVDERGFKGLEKFTPSSIMSLDFIIQLQSIVYRTIPEPGSLWGITVTYAHTMPKQQSNLDVKQKSLDSIKT